MMAVRKSIVHETNPQDLTGLFEAMEGYMYSSTKTTLLRDARFYDGWSGLFVKGTIFHIIWCLIKTQWFKLADLFVKG